MCIAVQGGPRGIRPIENQGGNYTNNKDFFETRHQTSPQARSVHIQEKQSTGLYQVGV